MFGLAQKIEPTQASLPMSDRTLTVFIREGMVTIGPALAERILNEARFSGQDARLGLDEVDHQVRILEAIMRKGIFRGGSLISFARLGDRLWLINGYHRLRALIRYGRAIDFRVGVDEIQSEAELPELFHHFDRNTQVRTDPQVLTALGVAKRHDLTKNAAKACWNAVAFLNNGMRNPTGTTATEEASLINNIVDLRADSAEPWWPHAAKMCRWVDVAPPALKHKLYVGSRFAVALLTVKYQPDYAIKFWNGLALDDGLRTGDPRKTLLKDLYNRKIGSGEADLAVRQVAVAWNAFLKDSSLLIIKATKDIPLRIAGTPYDGRPA